MLFERCDKEAKAIVEAALGESRRRGHTWLGTEHILLALAHRRHLLPPEAAALVPDGESVAAALDADLGGPARPDADLLKAVGIDLDAVRSTVRQTFGEAALEELGRRRVHQPWQPWRRPSRRCMSILAGSMSVAPRLKLALDRAWKDADRRKLVAIDPPTLFLGMIDVEDAMSNRILRDLGVDLDELGRSLLKATR